MVELYRLDARRTSYVATACDVQHDTEKENGDLPNVQALGTIPRSLKPEHWLGFDHADGCRVLTYDLRSILARSLHFSFG